MPATCRFVSEARIEYHEAIRYYAAEAASPSLAARFVAEVEAAIITVRTHPEIWRIVEEPDVRRYVLRHFPFLLYYRYEPMEHLVDIYALMHTSRRPGYWRERLS